MSAKTQNSTAKDSRKSKGCIKDIDIMSSEFNFRFNSKSGKFQTATGGYMTLMLGIICLATLFTALIQYFQKKDPVVSVSREAGAAFNEFNLYENSLWTPGSFAIGPAWLKSDTIGRFTTIVWEIEDTEFNPSTKQLEKRLVRRMYSVPCPQIVDHLMRNHIRDTVSVPRFDELVYCPDLKTSDGSMDDFKVSENLDKKKTRKIKMKFYPCSLEDRSKCAHPGEMFGMRVDFAKIDRLLKSPDFENPVDSILYRGYVVIDPAATKIIKKTVKRARVFDDISRFSAPVLKKEFIKLIYGNSDFKLRDRSQLHCSRSLIAAGGCQEYLSFDYAAYAEVEVFRRNYMKFTTLLGELGGLLKMFTTVVFFFYSIYNYREMNAFISRAVVNIDSDLLGRLKRGFGEDLRAKESHSQGTNQGSSQSSIKEQKKGKVGIERAAKQLVEERMNANNFIERINSLELIENSIFTDYEKKLIPLTLLQLKERERREESRKKDGKGGKSGDEMRFKDSRRSRLCSDQDLRWNFGRTQHDQSLRGYAEEEKDQREAGSIFAAETPEDREHSKTSDSESPSRAKNLQTAYKNLKSSLDSGAEEVNAPLRKYMMATLQELFEGVKISPKHK